MPASTSAFSTLWLNRAPCVSSRFSRIRSGCTRSPSTTRTPGTACNRAGWWRPAARPARRRSARCRARARAPRSRGRPGRSRAAARARPAIRSDVIGLRLCGIALEPFWPSRNGSSTSRTSVRCRWRISVASRSSAAPASAIRDSQHGVAVTRHHLGGDVLGAQAEPSSAPRFDVRAERRVGAHRAGELAHRELLERVAQPVRVAAALEREAGELQAEGGRLGVHAVRAADAERALELARPGDQRRGQRVRAGHDLAPGLAQLQRERGVEHVGGGQPVVDPAARLPDRLRDDVDERGHVVVGDLLALLHRLRRRGRARLDLLQVGGRGSRPARRASRRRRARPAARPRACAPPTRPAPSRDGCSARSTSSPGCAPPARPRSSRR